MLTTKHNTYYPTLRRLEPPDAEVLLSMESDAEVMQFSTGVIDPTEARRAQLSAFIEQSACKLGHWAVVVNGQTMGWVSLTPLDGTTHIQLAYRLCRQAWGHGYATLAARQVCDYAWETLGLPELVAVIWPGNERSGRVLEKLGFQFEKQAYHYDRLTLLYVLRNPAALTFL